MYRREFPPLDTEQDEKRIESLTNKELFAYLGNGDDAFYFEYAYAELGKRLRLSGFLPAP